MTVPPPGNGADLCFAEADGGQPMGGNDNDPIGLGSKYAFFLSRIGIQVHNGQL